MAKHIYFCKYCHEYTLKEVCSCKNKSITPKPPKYSPEDKYGDYRRKVKRDTFREKGLI
ncbi:MAG: nucleolar RNA-binding Nop10p family protein [Nanobdellota archaeon]